MAHAHPSRPLAGPVVTCEVTIDRLDPLGRGLAWRPEGAGSGSGVGSRLVVSDTLPGDRVRVAVGSDGRAQLEEIVEPSPQRVEPDCPWSGPCGGCDLIALAEPARQTAKAGWVEEVVASLGLAVGVGAGAAAGSSGPEILPFVAAAASEGYRHRCRLHQSRSHGRPDAGYLPAQGARIVPVEHCKLLLPALDERLIGLRAAIARLPFKVEEVRVAVAPEGKPRIAAHVVLAAGIAARSAREPLESLLGTAHLGGLTAGRIGRGVEVAFGNPRLGGAVAPGVPNGPCEFEPCHFTQGNAAMNKELVTRVLDFSGVGKGDRVVELFSGCGNLTLPLARAGAEVFAIEGDPGAVRMAHKNATRTNLEGRVRLAEGSVADVWKSAQREPTVLLLDPPREGFAAVGRVAQDLAPARVVHVACDVAAFARDARALLAAGYALRRVVGIDLYPRTRHLEIVALFAR